MAPHRCPLCLSPTEPLGSDRRRSYRRCPRCALIAVPSRFHLSPDHQRRRYRLHDNSPNNAEYVDYLREFAVTAAASGAVDFLDFGCGEHGVLTALLRQRGLDCTPYDPLYGIGEGAFGKTYGAVVLCEVLEHLADPRGELARIAGCVRAGGSVIVRTRLYTHAQPFMTWWYKEDPTHVVFACRQTLDVIAGVLRMRLLRCEDDQTAIFVSARGRGAARSLYF